MKREFSLSILAIILFITSANSLERVNLNSFQINEEIDKTKNVRMLFFFTSWCGICKSSFSHLLRLEEKYKDKNLAIFPISLDEEPQKLIAFLDLYSDKNLKVYHITSNDSARNIFSNFNIRYAGSIPHVTLLNKSGEIIVDGAYDLARFDNGLDFVLSREK